MVDDDDDDDDSFLSDTIDSADKNSSLSCRNDTNR
jgi:hypothetical protein